MSSPVVEPRLPASGSQDASGEATRKYTSPLDLYLKKLNPDHQLTPEHLVIDMILTGGADPSCLDELWEVYREHCEEMLRNFEAQPNNRIAFKPEDGDRTVQYYRIPSSSYAIRIWDGSMHQYGLWCLDLYDANRRIAVNLPNDYAIFNVPQTGVYTFGGVGAKLVSWEESWHVKREDLKPGQEKYTAPEGAQLMLQRPGREPFYFVLPVRPGLVPAAHFARPESSL